MHFAMLLNECGTGKTFTAALALSFVIHSNIMRTNVHPGSVLNGEQVYKPSIMFMPAATVNQAFNELTTLWRGVLDVYCLYHSRDNCTNPERKLRTLDNASEMQNLMDKLANEHLSPKTARVIILTSYATRISRISKAKKGIAINSSQISRMWDPDAQVSDEELLTREEERLINDSPEDGIPYGLGLELGTKSCLSLSRAMVAGKVLPRPLVES
ncbi:hypothetical protein BGZ61DRAFT_40934 [Ilyonectria robusta]|uniref:uncharacterized protein n=1 Tax=Ilyonectria robusta TaxID=1079257 RepID=UPI001E8E226F|nr:uncharacterized protein BGZ61DRAFT_40934 [Ilyonectria robusta]KAH8688306.1 hypothetical protein BGZ61DRAFT_40934 [Ilyonectria robusta]